jgi:hypothetical protein
MTDPKDRMPTGWGRWGPTGWVRVVQLTQQGRPLDNFSPDENTAHWIWHCLEDNELTNETFAEALRTFKNPVTDIFACLLERPGFIGRRLILKQARRGRSNRELPGLIAHLYDEVVEEHGKRNAIKRLAQEMKVSPARIRSALRRIDGTHKRRTKRGRK